MSSSLIRVNRFALFGAALAFIVAIVGLALPQAAWAAYPMTITHELGETRLEAMPQRVIVFDFGSLDTLDTLGVDVIALPKSVIPGYLSKYSDDRYVNVGTLQEPDFERIYSLSPDLIIISGRQSALYEEFAAIAPTIYLAVDPTRYMESFEENAVTLGRIFGKEELVAEKIAGIKSSVADVRARAQALGASTLIVLANEGKVSAYGPGSRYGLIHDELGFVPSDPKIVSSTHGQSISFEYILQQDPQILFVIDRTAAIGGESSAKAVVENRLVQLTRAYENDKIIYLDPEVWYLSGGGLASVARMVEQVASALD